MSLVDLLLITPLDEEWRQSRSVLKSRPIEVGEGPVTYYLWTINSKTPPGAVHLVTAASMGKMGIANAAGFSKTALETWDPYSIVLLGIAGSLKPAEILLGDVMISEEVFGYEVGEALSDGTFQFRPTGHQTGALLLDRARALRNNPVAYSRWQSACMKAAEKEKGLVLPRPPEIHFGVTASGNFVVKSAAFREELRRQLHPKIGAVEMEAKGVFTSVHQLEAKAQPLVVRGISDYADEEKSRLEAESKDAWRRLACGNAARFLRNLMDRNPFIPKSPRLQLKLNASSPRLLLEHGLFLREKGAVNLAFEDIFDGQTANPEIKLEVLAFAGVKPTVPARSACLLHYDDHVRVIKPQVSAAGALSLQVPRCSARRKVDLLVALTDSTDTVLVACRDEFGRQSRAEWR